MVSALELTMEGSEDVPKVSIRLYLGHFIHIASLLLPCGHCGGVLRTALRASAS